VTKLHETATAQNIVIESFGWRDSDEADENHRRNIDHEVIRVGLLMSLRGFLCVPRASRIFSPPPKKKLGPPKFGAQKPCNEYQIASRLKKPPVLFSGLPAKHRRLDAFSPFSLELSHHLRKRKAWRSSSRGSREQAGRMILRIRETPSAARSRRWSSSNWAAGRSSADEIIEKNDSSRSTDSGRHRSDARRGTGRQCRAGRNSTSQRLRQARKDVRFSRRQGE